MKNSCRANRFIGFHMNLDKGKLYIKNLVLERDLYNFIVDNFSIEFVYILNYLVLFKI